MTTGKSIDLSYPESLNSIIPDGYIYISHLDEEVRFWRLPVLPQTINDSMQSNFASTNALGRSAPVYTFSNSGPRTVQFDITLHREMMEDANVGVSNSKLATGEDYVENLVKALQSIAVPRYNLDNKAVEPPMVAVRLANQVFIKGVVTSSIGVSYKTPILYNNKYAEVSISFSISETDPYDASTVYKNGSFRGVVSTLKKNMGLSDGATEI